MQFLQEKHISLRTFRKTGVNVDTPVWFITTDDSIHYVFSASVAGKVKRLRNSSTAQIASCDFMGGSLGEWVDCHAYLVADRAELNRAHEKFISKYGYIMRVVDFFSWLTGRLNNRAYIRIEL